MEKKKYKISSRYGYIQYQVRELDITIANKLYYHENPDRYREAQKIYYDELHYLDALQALGYKYYEKDPEKADINDREYTEDEEPMEFIPQNELLDIKELYENSDGFKAIVYGISKEGLDRIFKRSNIDNQIAFVRALEKNIKDLEDQCIFTENTLLRFESREKDGYNVANIKEYSYDLNQKELDKLREISKLNKLLDHLVEYLNSRGIEYNTESRDTFGTGNIKYERKIPEEKTGFGSK